MIEGSWQKKLKFRGLRLIGWTLPVMLFSVFATSLVSHVPPKLLFERPWGDKKFISGRFESPKKGGTEVNVLLQLDGVTPIPRKTQASLRFKTLDGKEDIKKSWTLMPVPDGKRWKALFFTSIPDGQTLAYFVRVKADTSAMTDVKVQLIADPERSVNKYLRFAELLFYPMLALSLLGVVMVVFPHLFAS